VFIYSLLSLTVCIYRLQLIPETKSQILLFSITSIKLGSGKYEKCINIISESKVLVLKIDDEGLLRQIVEGFILIVEKNRIHLANKEKADKAI
jgi:hypothetical protein